MKEESITETTTTYYCGYCKNANTEKSEILICEARHIKKLNCKHVYLYYFIDDDYHDNAIVERFCKLCMSEDSITNYDITDKQESEIAKTVYDFVKKNEKVKK